MSQRLLKIIFRVTQPIAAVRYLKNIVPLFNLYKGCLMNMKKNILNYITRWFTLLPVLLFLVTSCTVEEPEVNPQQTCDTQAQVQIRDGCGLALILKNKQVLIPANEVPLRKTSAGKQQYKINNFTVTNGEQVIIGYEVKSQSAATCSTGSAAAVNVTCVVGYQAQP